VHQNLEEKKSMYEMTVAPSIKALKNLSAFLNKANEFASAKKLEPEVLLQSRLAPDQFPLTRQIQIACDTAKIGMSRLTGKEAPSHPDTEKTLAEVQARIQSTLDYLQSFTAKDFAGAESKHITTPRWEGQYLTGQEFMIHHLIPNLYFHVTTAYAILRHNGVDLGKKDYLGEMPFKK
jgi:hypothetical protein